MGGFGEYIEKKRENMQVVNQPLQEEAQQMQQIPLQEEVKQEQQIAMQPQDIYERQRTKGMGDPNDAVDSVFSYEEKTRQLQENNTTFQERTDYYFKDPRYLEAKKDRYLSLASDKDGEVKAYSQKYKNRSARKRKNRAADAAKCFAKAADLEKSLASIDEDDLQAEDLYKAKEEIMMARLEGMINAAKVKATSEKDEKFRIAKAKLTCYSALLEQFQNARIVRSESLEGMQKTLQDEIKAARDDMTNYEKTAVERWSEQKLDTKQILRDSQNPQAKEKDVAFSVLINSFAMESDRPEYKEAKDTINETIDKQQKAGEEPYLGTKIGDRHDELSFPAYVIVRNLKGEPINPEEKKKEEWNKRWLAALKDPQKVDERKNMLRESFERFKALKFPSPEEIQQKGLGTLMKEDPVWAYSFVQFSLRWANATPLDRKFFEDAQILDQELTAKLDAATPLAQMMKEVMTQEFQMDERRKFKFFQGERFATKEERRMKDQQSKEMCDTLFQTYTEGQKQVVSAEKTVETLGTKKREGTKVPPIEEARKLAKGYGVDRVPESSYRVYAEFRKTNQQLRCPAYVNAFAPVREKLGGRGNSDVSRVLGPVLKQVHFNEKWEPVSSEDREAHEWNLQFLVKLNIKYFGTHLTETEKDLMHDAEKKKQEGSTPISRHKYLKKNADGKTGTYENLKENIKRNAWYDEEKEKWLMEYTEEDYQNDEVIKKVNETQTKNEEDFLETIKNSYEENFEKNAIDLPSPEELLKEFLAGESPLLDNLMKDKEQYVLMSAQILACEDLLKTLGYEKEVIEDGWFYEKYKPYTDAMGALINIVTLYTSAKFGFEPGLGVDAHFGASGAMMNDEVKKALVDNYRVSYNKYNHIEEPQKKEA